MDKEPPAAIPPALVPKTHSGGDAGGFVSCPAHVGRPGVPPVTPFSLRRLIVRRGVHR